MKGLYLTFLCVLIAGLVVLIAFFNSDNSAEFSMFMSSLSLDGVKETVSTKALLLTSYFFGVVTGLLFMLPFVFKSENSLKAYERKLEKTLVSNDSSSAKIQVLQNKIDVLEKALEDALRNR